MSPRPHIAILGAGPTGLEAALAAVEHGFPFTLYESGDTAAGAVRAWGHVHLFTPWSMNASSRMREALKGVGHHFPDDDDHPTGAELAANLLAPLAALPALRDHLRLRSRVLAIGRQGLLKHEEIGTERRARRPFRLLVADAEGCERIEEAGVVLDCTGATVPNSLGEAGIPAPGERGLGAAICRTIPDFGSDTQAWEGKTTLLVGAGHSAQTAACGLGELVTQHPGTRLIWALRSPDPDWGAIPDDPLPRRAELAARVEQLVASSSAGLALHHGVTVDSIEAANGQLTVCLRRASGEHENVYVNRILSLTGTVGDHLLYRQLQVHECYATSGPMKLAAALLGAGGSGDCLAQTSQGADTLVNPEPGFFILGIKSYGRRNDYLMRVGWQQVDEVFGLLATG